MNKDRVLLKNGTPVARLAPDNEKVCTGHDLAAALSKTRLAEKEAASWHQEMRDSPPKPSSPSPINQLEITACFSPYRSSGTGSASGRGGIRTLGGNVPSVNQTLLCKTRHRRRKKRHRQGSLFLARFSAMASVWKHPESKYWFACFNLPDGTRTKRSTKKTSRTEAQKIADKFEEAARNMATESQARQVLSDIYEIVRGRGLKSATIEDFLLRWAAARKNEVSTVTAAKYLRTVRQFIKHLGDKAKQDLSHLDADDVASYRDSIAATRSTGTANLALKIVRIALGQGKRDGLILSNPADQIKILKEQGQETERRPFTLEELGRLLDVADTEMKGLIMFGLYTGQRLGDLARLTWQNLDLQEEELYFVTGKTRRRQRIPLAKPLLKYIESLPAGNTPDAPMFPRAFQVVTTQQRTGTLSNQFHSTLVAAGLAEKRTHEGTGNPMSSVWPEQARWLQPIPLKPLKLNNGLENRPVFLISIGPCGASGEERRLG